MATCSKCKRELPDTAKYCPDCGFPTATQNGLSDFELGKLAALTAIKADIISWFRSWGVGIGLAAAVLAYFGMNELIKGTVSEKVQSELREDRNEIRKSLENEFSLMSLP